MECRTNPNIEELFSSNILGTCKYDPTLFEKLLRIAFLNDDNTLFVHIQKLQMAPPNTLTDLNTNIIDLLLTSHQNEWPTLNNSRCCTLCEYKFNEKSDLIKHSRLHKNPLISNLKDEIFCALQKLYNNKIVCRMIDLSKAAIIFKESDLIYRVPGCAFIARNEEELFTHQCNRTDFNHAIFMEYCEKYGPFYGAIKAYLYCKGTSISG